MRIRTKWALVAASVLGLGGCKTHDAQQLVKDDPATVSKAFADAFSEGAMGGASQYSNLWHGGMQTFVERQSDHALDVVTKFDGETASEVHFAFTPQDGGKATLVDADVSMNTAIMAKAFTGTPQERLAGLPEAAYVNGMQRLMAKYAERIEGDMPLSRPEEGWQTAAMEPPPEFYEGMPEAQLAEIRRHDQEERQDAAAQPMMNPNDAARRYMSGQ